VRGRAAPRGPGPAFKGMAALAPVPAVVVPARGGRLVVDLLVAVLADVADPQGAGGGGEREPPGVAPPDGPDPGAGAVPAHERVAPRDPVGAAAGGAGVDAE